MTDERTDQQVFDEIHDDAYEPVDTVRRVVIFVLTAVFLFLLMRLLTADTTVTATAVRYDPVAAERQRREWQKRQDKHIKKIVLRALREHEERKGRG